MPHTLRNNKPSTYIVRLFENANRFVVYDSKGKIYFYRDLPNGLREFKVNIPDEGIYTFNNKALVKQKPIEINYKAERINFPRKERNRAKKFYFTYDANETTSPALIYTGTGEIVRGRKFKELSKPMQIFILLHELGHFYYQTEEFCDLYALYHFLKMGYNPSTAMYCLVDQLRRNPNNDKRILSLYNELLKADLVK